MELYRLLVAHPVAMILLAIIAAALIHAWLHGE